MNLQKMRTWAEVNLSNFKNNIEVIKKHTGSNVKINAVVKADAYGHGAVVLAKEALLSGADYLSVACVEEGIELRNAKIECPIIILSHSSFEEADKLVKYNLIPTVFDIGFAKKLNSSLKEKIKVHIKLDTGMTRLGFDTLDVEKTVNDIIFISNLENIEINGIFTHFADADNEGATFTNEQFERYLKIIDALLKKGLHIPLKHSCNSAAMIERKEMYLDMVRCGIIIYGYYPDKYLKKVMPGVKPVLELKSKLLQIRDIDEGVTISYGRTFKSEKKMRVGVVPCGYADGYSRLLSNKFYVLVCGKKANILGRVCMDQMIVDLSGIPEAKEGDTVTLIGEDGTLKITADDIADALGTISYEVLCNISKRVPRVYVL